MPLKTRQKKAKPHAFHRSCHAWRYVLDASVYGSFGKLPVEMAFTFLLPRHWLCLGPKRSQSHKSSIKI